MKKWLPEEKLPLVVGLLSLVVSLPSSMKSKKD